MMRQPGAGGHARARRRAWSRACRCPWIGSVETRMHGASGMKGRAVVHDAVHSETGYV
jgi:hypothetical protein